VPGAIARGSLSAFLLLKVDLKIDVRDAPVRQRRPAREARDVFHVCGAHDAARVDADVLEDAVQVHVLLRMRVDEIVVMVPGDGEDGLPVELGVVKTVEQVKSTWSRGGDAHAEPSGVLGIRAGHEGGRLLVAGLNEPDVLTSRAEGFHDAVDAVPWHPKDDLNAPLAQNVDQDVRGGVTHHIAPSASIGLVVASPSATAAKGPWIERFMQRHRRARTRKAELSDLT
jgi:hypothetical protein